MSSRLKSILTLLVSCSGPHCVTRRTSITSRSVSSSVASLKTLPDEFDHICGILLWRGNFSGNANPDRGLKVPEGGSGFIGKRCKVKSAEDSELNRH